jgi:Phosphotransferase system mannitol/fructose-specific IIA domain (Ntr-type)
MALHLELFNKRHPHQANEVTLVIVCSSGYGTAQLLRQRVIESVKDVTIVGTMSVSDFMEKAPVTDIVLSTVPLKMDKTRVLQVSPFLNETEVELLKKVCDEVRKREYIHAEFMELLRPECIIADSELTDKNAVIQKLTKRLYQHGYVDQKMADSALEREKLATTKLGKIAIPHGGIEHVLKPTLGILTSQAGIKWNHAGQVNLVFFIAFNQQLESQMDDIYAYFYSLIKNQEIIDQLVHASSSEAIITLLENSELDV